jgi:hypothetical protein
MPPHISGQYATDKPSDWASNGRATRNLPRLARHDIKRTRLDRIYHLTNKGDGKNPVTRLLDEVTKQHARRNDALPFPFTVKSL